MKKQNFITIILTVAVFRTLIGFLYQHKLKPTIFLAKDVSPLIKQINNR